MSDVSETDNLFRRAQEGDEQALADLFSSYRDSLKRMVRLRMNRALQGRVDDSDVVQDALLDAIRRFHEYSRNPALPFFIWLRQITVHKLVDVHRRHLGAKMRDARQVLSLHQGPFPAADSVSLAAHLLGKMTSPSNAAIRSEMRLRVQEVLNGMEDLDRELLALRHFEQLTNVEAAQVLGINPSTASSRYLRALKRLKGELEELPGWPD